MLCEWREDLQKGRQEAADTEKPLLLFFYSPACFFCQQMEMISFSEQKVFSRLEKEFVILRVTTDSLKEFRAYNISATPAFLVLGPTGMEYERFTGFFDTQDLMAFCLTGLGKWRYDIGQADLAQTHAEELTSVYPDSVYAPEGLFLRGIYRYQNSKDRNHLQESYNILARQYPDSPWVNRSRLLHLYPCAFFKWDAYRNKGWSYWENHQVLKELPSSGDH